MKKLVLAAAFAGAASAGFAGTVADPVIEPEVITTTTQNSSAGIVVPLIILAVLLAAVAD